VRGKRRGQNHLDRQAGEIPARPGTVGAARSRRHVSRRRKRTAGGVGRTQQRDSDRATGRRRRRGDLRRHSICAGAQDRRGAGRHRRAADHAGASDGRNQEGQARDRQGLARSAARGVAGAGCQHRAKRALAGQSLRRGARRDRPDPDQAGRHRQGRRDRRDRQGAPDPGALHRRRRRAGRPAPVRRGGFCRSAAGAGRAVVKNYCDADPVSLPRITQWRMGDPVNLDGLKTCNYFKKYSRISSSSRLTL